MPHVQRARTPKSTRVRLVGSESDQMRRMAFRCVKGGSACASSGDAACEGCAISRGANRISYAATKLVSTTIDAAKFWLPFSQCFLQSAEGPTASEGHSQSSSVAAAATESMCCVSCGHGCAATASWLVNTAKAAMTEAIWRRVLFIRSYERFTCQRVPFLTQGKERFSLQFDLDHARAAALTSRHARIGASLSRRQVREIPTHQAEISPFIPQKRTPRIHL
jgi:hypothetical protein